ncbi:DUF6880 family protein [Pararhodospirillum photometricum]|uniref:DUF6880 family protein n=1 Tax=Pararhodospirillum photometricum TaxID=1084 RepID=UPI00059FB81A|nr:DUF6880 family protein [Pararhodospirillum photometricum]
MAGKTSLSPESLIALGSGVLARLILEEAEGSPAFRKRLKAAPAGAKGPAAVSDINDWDGFDSHDAYRFALRQSHGRKTLGPRRRPRRRLSEDVGVFSR